jgi:hypothetical protein
MLHAYFYTICLVFCYTSWRFYAFFGTNLLTRCYSVSSLFSAVFVFQKSYIGNILGIGRNKNRTSKNLPKLPEVWRGDGEGPRADHTTGRHGLGYVFVPSSASARLRPETAPQPPAALLTAKGLLLLPAGLNGVAADASTGSRPRPASRGDRRR